jgi:hypothetical protein
VSRHETTMWVELVPTLSRWDPDRVWAVRTGRVRRRRPPAGAAGHWAKVTLNVPSALFTTVVRVDLDVPEPDTTVVGVAEGVPA